MGVPQTASLFDPGPTAELLARTLNRRSIIDAWLEAPGMIHHRPAYFADEKVSGKITRVLRVYDAEDVVAAIGSYATVVNGEEYWWTHKWTFLDFLQRGLDRFVTEADPLTVFSTEWRSRSVADAVDENIRWLNRCMDSPSSA